MFLSVLFFLAVGAHNIAGEAISCSESFCVVNDPQKVAECGSTLTQTNNLTSGDFTSSCEAVYIYLTSGIHIISKMVEFDFGDAVAVAIHGKPNDTTVICQDQAGLVFTNKSMFLKDIIFSGCNGRYNIISGGKKMIEALVFIFATFELRNVTVKHSEGNGLYASGISEDGLITNCSFYNNTYGHVNIWLEHQNCRYQNDTTTINITKTHFEKGNSKNGYYMECGLYQSA